MDTADFPEELFNEPFCGNAKNLHEDIENREGYFLDAFY
jgi:hypothetical protein